ncbi:hypothetical protein BDP27DRAFT_1368243 [Rhodocollybia butyracea]|uniref:Uncharacterized protein n=1 Tax=Rhodocollybia butyracea TaxID=206335 RepID=A0A9P5U260_9AGAR|nr:hypothetical protein BDP27DRAFT_1368243 [Rhodocollybia butyracea]
MAYQTSQAVRDLKSRAHSTTYNRRNIEHDWYPAWNQVFMDMKSLLPHVYVYPQHLLWIRPSEALAPALREAMQARLDEGEDLTEDIDEADKALLQFLDEVDDEDLAQLSWTDPVDGDTSFGSTITIPGSEKDLKPDFSFMHLRVTSLSAVHMTSAYGRKRAGRKVIHECYFALCELKAAPSRRLRLATAQAAARAQLFESARNQLAKYANLYFLAEGGLARQKVLLWACIGAFWSWASISREALPAWNWQTNSFVDIGKTAGYLAYHGSFSDHFELCTARSDLEINKLIIDYFQSDSIHEHAPGQEGSDDDMNEE